MKKLNKRGFTLAELLIVVAIIAVLVAVAIPVFNSQLEKSKEAVDKANIRSAYGEAMAMYLADNTSATSTVTVGDIVYNYSMNTDTNVMTVSVAASEGLKAKVYKNGGIKYTGGENFTTNATNG